MKKFLSVNNLCKALFLLTVSLLAIFFAYDTDTQADEVPMDLYDASVFHNVLDLNITISTGVSSTKLLDEDYSTSIELKKGVEVTVKCDTPMYSTFIIWDSLVPEWTMKIGDNTYTFGQNGFLHEYVVLPEVTTEYTIIIPDGSDLGSLYGVYKGGMRLADIYAFPDENIPSWVQTWDTPLTDADILMLPTHADDEYIYLGGIAPMYVDQGKKVQMVWFIEHWTNKVREHEKLSAMWVAGLTNYPITGNFYDHYCTSLNGALDAAKWDDAVSFIVDTIRQTHPLVVVIHDKNGEYGHGQHRLSSAATVEAVQLASLSTYNAESAEKYGTWNVPKLYMHLATEHPIKLNYRTALASFNNETALDVAKQAYNCHMSQHQYGYTIDDFGQYDNSAFGLIYSTVGFDTDCDDLLENIDYENIDSVRSEAAVSYASEDDEFIPIYTASDLEQLRTNGFGSFRLMNDIDMTGVEWTPVDFSGKFDGNGFSIINATITTLTTGSELTTDGNRKTYDTHFSGFFGIVKDAEIYDLSLLGVTVDITADCDTFAGSLCGFTYDTTITNCKVTGTVSLRVTGKMFGVGGLMGYGGATTVDSCDVNTTLINIDLDKETKDEQFMGGISGDGYVDVKNSTITIDGYDSDHGYVHDGGINGMYILYDTKSHEGYVKNNKVSGTITFFEDNTDRRAYCSAYIGENMSSSYTTISGNSNTFTRNEVYDYDTDLLPHYCTGNSYAQVTSESDEKTCGVQEQIYICTECNSYTYTTYVLTDHTYESRQVLKFPTYTETGLEKCHCSICDKDIYLVTDMLPMPTATPTPTLAPTHTPAPTATPTPVVTPTDRPIPTPTTYDSDSESIFNRILMVVSIVILAVVFAFLPVIVKKKNK